MASEDDKGEGLSEGTHEPRECMACRGTGRVISNLGGSPSTVSCPWCAGAGLRLVDIDAQAHWPASVPPAQAPPADAPVASVAPSEPGQPEG